MKKRRVIRNDLYEIRNIIFSVFMLWVVTVALIVINIYHPIQYWFRPHISIELLMMSIAFFIDAISIYFFSEHRILPKTKIVFVIIFITEFLHIILSLNGSSFRKIIMISVIYLFISIGVYICYKFKCKLLLMCVKKIIKQGTTGIVFSFVWETIKENQLSRIYEKGWTMNYLLCGLKGSGKTTFCQDYVKCQCAKESCKKIYIYDYCIENKESFTHNYDSFEQDDKYRDSQIKIPHISKLSDFLDYVQNEIDSDATKTPITIIIDAWKVNSKESEVIVSRLLFLLRSQVTVIMVTESLEILPSHLLSIIMKHFRILGKAKLITKINQRI